MTDYGLETGETWDFGESKLWRFLRITKSTPKYITFRLSNGTYDYGNQLDGGQEWRRKVFHCLCNEGGDAGLHHFHIRINKYDNRCFNSFLTKLTKPSQTE